MVYSRVGFIRVRKNVKSCFNGCSSLQASRRKHCERSTFIFWEEELKSEVVMLCDNDFLSRWGVNIVQESAAITIVTLACFWIIEKKCEKRHLFTIKGIVCDKSHNGIASMSPCKSKYLPTGSETEFSRVKAVFIFFIPIRTPLFL